MTTSSTPVRIVEKTPAYWRVLFDKPPLNVVDGSVFEGLQELLSRMDTSPDLRVVVFESANPEFYLAHFDMTGKSVSVAKTVTSASEWRPVGWGRVHQGHRRRDHRQVGNGD